MTKNMKLAAALTALMLPAGSVFAAGFTAAGCGLGSMLFHNGTTKSQLVLAATTNDFLGTQTFGISSDTLGCTSSGVVKADRRVEAYAEANFSDLSRDVARGGGESLAGLAALLGKTDASAQARFFKTAQANYERLFPAGATPQSFVAAVATL